jgi:Sulfatase
VLLVLSALAGAGASSCRRRMSFPGAPVFLISIDTLRADHLAAWGGRGAATPAIDALAKDGILFENALSHVPLTLPSHATIFTGLLPFQNGVRDNLGYRLPDGTPTLAGLLKSRGYATGGAVSSAVLDRSTGIGAGFDFWDDRLEASRAGEALGDVQRPGSESSRLATRPRDWRRSRSRTRRLPRRDADVSVEPAWIHRFRDPGGERGSARGSRPGPSRDARAVPIPGDARGSGGGLGASRKARGG